MSILFISTSIEYTSSFNIQSGSVDHPDFDLQSGSQQLVNQYTLGQLNADFSNNTISFTLVSQSTGGSNDLTPLTISGSGDKALIGVGTTDPLRALDIRSVSSSDPANIILRTNEDGTIQVGEETGRVVFAIESASYLGTNFITSGSTAAIYSEVIGSNPNGARGSLIFEVSKNDNVTPIEIMRLGHGFPLDELQLGGIYTTANRPIAFLSASMIIDGEDGPYVHLRGGINSGNPYRIADLGVTIESVNELSDAQADYWDRGSLKLFHNNVNKVDLNSYADYDWIDTGKNLGIGIKTPTHKLHVDGDIKATGDIIAQRYIISSSVSHITSSFSSGSTVFGDTLDDTHQFTGSILYTGSLDINGMTYPTTDGVDGQTLQTDGGGNLTFEDTSQIFLNVKNKTGAQIDKGTPLYASGSSGNGADVYIADASNPSTMPAAFIAREDIAIDAEGKGVISGFVNGIDTSGFSAGDTIYVAGGGGYTNVKPTGSALIQNIGKAIKIDGSNGSLVVVGAGRSNDVPNITSGYAWVGNSDQVATAVATSSFVVDTASLANEVAFTNITGKPTLISSSAQIDHDSTTNFSADEHFTQANITTVGTVTSGDVSAILPAGTISSSAQVTITENQISDLDHYTDSDVKTKLNTENVVSGSASSVRTFLNVEDGADVTDTTNVTAAGALMDSEVTSLSLIKELTAAQISGAFDATSASLAANIPTNNNQLTNGAGYTTNTGTVTSVGGTGTVSGLSLSGTVTTSGNLTLGGTISLVAGDIPTITSAKISDVDAFSQSGTYASLRAQGTTAGDVGLGNVTNESKATMFSSPTFTGTVSGVTKAHVGLGNVENTALSTYTGNGGALDNQYITNGAGYLTTVDISTDTNLVGGTNLTLSGDTMNLDASINLTTVSVGGYNSVTAAGTLLDIGAATEWTTIRYGKNGAPYHNFQGRLSTTGDITASSNVDIQGTLSLPGFADVSASLAAAAGGGSGTVTEVTVGTGLDVTNGTTTPNITLDLTEITVGTGLDTTATGISLDLTEVGFAAGGGNRLITNDGDGTVTSEANLTFDGTTLNVDGQVDIDEARSSGAVVDINNTYSGIMGSTHYALKVTGGQANGTPGSAIKAYGGHFTAGNTNGTNPDTIALYAQGHEDGAPNSYAAIFSGSAGGVVGINTLEPTVELDVVGSISASSDIVAAGKVLPQYESKVSSFFSSDGNGDLIPFGGTLNENTLAQYYSTVLVPYGGKIIKAYVLTTSSGTGAFTLTVRKYTGLSTYTEIASGSATISTSYTPTLVEFSDHTFDPGDSIGIWFDPTGTPSGVNITTLWRMESI